MYKLLILDLRKNPHTNSYRLLRKPPSKEELAGRGGKLHRPSSIQNPKSIDFDHDDGAAGVGWVNHHAVNEACHISGILSLFIVSVAVVWLVVHTLSAVFFVWNWNHDEATTTKHVIE